MNRVGAHVMLKLCMKCAYNMFTVMMHKMWRDVEPFPSSMQRIVRDMAMIETKECLLLNMHCDDVNMGVGM